MNEYTISSERVEVERILAALPESQRRPIEQYFGFASEVSIALEIQRTAERHLFGSVSEYEAAVKGSDQTARSLAIAKILGH